MSILKILQSPFRLNIIKLTNSFNRSLCEKAVDVNTNVAKDVILFKHDNSRFFKVLNIFALCQFGFWNYLAHFAFTTLKDAPVVPSENTAWWRKINLGENKYRNGITILSFCIGWGILAVTWMYSLRSVKYLVLRKGGQDLSFVTYTPFGSNRIMDVNLRNVSCAESRSSAQWQLPLKVKGHYLYYLIDMKGEFRNPKLFDHTAGLRRNLK